MALKKELTIAIDFDRTIVEHQYPEIGEEQPFATAPLRLLIAEQHELTLWSVREKKLLEEAVEWYRLWKGEFYAVNKDYPKEEKIHAGFSRKIKADSFIDDRNLMVRSVQEEESIHSHSIVTVPCYSREREVVLF